MKINVVGDGLTITSKAHAEVNGPNINGQAYLTEYDLDGAKYVHLSLSVEADIKAVTPGKHAVHIHEKGACDCDGFKCAGGHFDPGPFGNTDPDANHGFHAGDLPSITIDDDGHGKLEAVTTRVTLSSGPVSLLDQPDGTSIMIHANPDPHTPGESGSGHSGGPRLACGTINKVNL